MSVVSSEFIIHHSAPGSDLQLKKINNQLTKTWSSPFLYDPQAIPRVPPILSQQDSSSSVDSDYCEKTKILYPTQTHFPDVQLDVPVKLIILGSKQVGKSALALRYLTKNQCDTSKISGVAGSSNALRRQGRQRSPTIAVEVEILDIKPLETNKLAEFVQQLKTCDAIIVMYSLTDRISFHVAREILDDLANLGSVVCPVLLLANKMDLCQHRKVSVTEGRELSRAFTQDIITFHEVSVAHCPDDIMRMFTRLLQSISHIKHNIDKLPTCTQSFHGVKDVKKPKVSERSQNLSENARSRKPSVFCVAGRMLNNLMGRGSMPPELPSSVSGGPISRSHPNSPVPGGTEGVFSFRKVFKKRSV